MTASYDYYERSQPGLGGKFVEAVRLMYAEIGANPLGHGIAARGVREAVLSRFPFAVYYRVSRNRVRVIAVYHTARDPAGWQSRR